MPPLTCIERLLAHLSGFRVRVWPLFAILLVAINPLSASSNGLKSFEKYLINVQSGKTRFTQTVTSPGKEGQAPRVKTSSGRFAFIRPNQFRFDYEKPFVQTLVADGRDLWLYDPDLAQITVKNQQQALAQTPAALIAATADLASLQKNHVLTDLPDADGLAWLQVVPKQKDGSIVSMRLGFDAGSSNHPVLAVLEITDGLGQRSVIRFSQQELGATVPASLFQFTPPSGVDLIRQ